MISCYFMYDSDKMYVLPEELPFAPMVGDEVQLNFTPSGLGLVRRFTVASRTWVKVMNHWHAELKVT